MTEPETSSRKSLSGRRPSFSSIRSRLRKPSLMSGGSKKRSSVIVTDDDSAMDDDLLEASQRRSFASDRSIPPVPPLPPRPADHAAAQAPALPSLESAHLSNSQDKRASVISSSPSITETKPEESGIAGLAQTSLGLTLGAHQHDSERPTVGSNPRALGAFKDTIPMTMLFFGGTVVSALILARFSIIAAVVVAACSGHVLYAKLQAAGQDTKWALEMEEAARKASIPGKDEESVEWLNKALATAWPLINSDYFAPFVDLLEDSLMTQVPGIVHSVRVEDMDQGSIPLRVKSFRLLPSDESCFLEGAVAQAKKDADQNNTKVTTGTAEGAAGGTIAGQGNDLGQDTPGLDDSTGVDVGDFVNLEVTFAYRGAPATKKGRLRSSMLASSNTAHASDTVGATASNSGEDDSGADSLINTPTERIHLLMYLSVGLQKIAAVEVPVWIEMVGIEGKARVRLQMTPVAPFVKHAAITFVGAPKLEMSAKPLGKKMVIDAMNLPLMSTYVRHAVEDVIKGFIAPLSYTVDVAGLLGAGDGPLDVYSVGVICFVLHQADDLAASDSNGQSDPFVQASYARAGKPLFTSRIVRKRRDAIWQETGFLLVSPDEVRDHDRLRLTVFDADRFSADDPLGKIEIPIDRLIRKFRPNGDARSTNLLETRTDALRPMRKGTPVQGTLKYSVGFFGLAHAPGSGHAPSRRKLLRTAASRSNAIGDSVELLSPVQEGGAGAAGGKKLPPLPTKDLFPEEDLVDGLHEAKGPPQTGDVDADLLEYMTGFDRFVHGLGLPMDNDVLRARKDRKERVKKLADMIEGAKQATVDPPNPELPSGILAFHIHSLHGLEVPATQKSLGSSKRLSQKSRHGAAPTEESHAEGGAAGKLPSSYVQVFLNDEAIFRTRTKTLNPRPYVNAGSERFVADWTTARMDFTVRDARMREGDPVLGCVGLRLADVLKNSSRSTGWYTLVGGLGFGKMRLTILFRSVELSVPRPLRGWNVGVIEIDSCKAVGMPQNLFDNKSCHILFETVGGRLSTDELEPVEDYESGTGDAATVSYDWPIKEPLRIPVRQRYPNALYINLRSDSRMPGRRHHHAWAYIPLNRIADGMPLKRRIRLFETTDWVSVEQDVLRALCDPELLQTSEERPKPQMLPVLEDLCTSASKGLSDAAVAARSNLKVVGHLDISMIFHRGIGQEHRSCTAGDSEMRFAYETYMTLMDAGERAPSRTLAAERRRQLSKASRASLQPIDVSAAQDQSQAGTLEGGPSSPEAISSTTSSPTKKRTHRRILSDVSAGGVLIADPEEMSEGNEDERSDIVDSDSLYAPSITESEIDRMLEDTDPDTPEGRRARARALHRHERGAAQLKGFRTLTWMKTNAEDGMAKMKRQFGKQSKRIGKMESEGISHF
ncbi:hypothetical protein BCV70DRAFT_202924 [Testicularia cyperi]|uniref:C2 domain-containing protein n=1 Tax=Testicularia cyperi TaxID=1882483 RepID=A0A317XG84_9BASI|nr:hypothetical protein BCV70DRAFT_202924 [Testicularia cyperi]